MSRPGPSKPIVASSFFSSAPAIRIPTFQSPAKRPTPAQPTPQTRDEERQARLKGPAGQWDNLNKLLPKGPQPLPSFGKRVGAVPSTAGGAKGKGKTPRKSLGVEKATTAGKPTTPSAAASSSKSKDSKRKSSVAAVLLQPEEEEEQQQQPVKKKRKSSVSVAASAPKAKRKSSVVAPAAAAPSPSPSPEPEEVQAVPLKKKRKSSAAARPSLKKVAPPPPSPPVPAPALAPAKIVKRRKPSIKAPSAIELHEPPVASTSKSAPSKLKKRQSAVKLKLKAAVVLEQEEEEQVSAPKPIKVWKVKPASKKREREVEEAEPEPVRKPVSAPVKPPSSKAKSKKRVRISEILSSPPPVDVDAFSDAEVSIEDTQEESYRQQQHEASLDGDESEGSADEDGNEGDEGGKKKGIKIRTERLKGNKGKLNAIDVAYGGVSKLLLRKMDALKPSRAFKSLSRYSTNVQTLLLTRSDQLSTLASASAAVSAAKSRAKQLRVDLLNVQRARAGVGKRMREEEEEWRESRKRGESTRSLHAFLNDLSSASMDWSGPPPDDSAESAPAVHTNIQPRLERLAALLGPPSTSSAASSKGKGKAKAGAKMERSAGLVGRVERLNAELRMERL